MKHVDYSSDQNIIVSSGSGSGTGVITNPIVLVPVVNLGDATYRYKYNGKEYQDELGLNMYDMEWRQYNPAIARWVVQDPIVHHDVSPNGHLRITRYIGQIRQELMLLKPQIALLLTEQMRLHSLKHI